MIFVIVYDETKFVKFLYRGFYRCWRFLLNGFYFWSLVVFSRVLPLTLLCLVTGRNNKCLSTQFSIVLLLLILFTHCFLPNFVFSFFLLRAGATLFYLHHILFLELKGRDSKQIRWYTRREFLIYTSIRDKSYFFFLICTMCLRRRIEWICMSKWTTMDFIKGKLRSFIFIGMTIKLSYYLQIIICYISKLVF